MTDNVVQFDPNRFAGRRMRPMNDIDRLIATYGAEAIMVAMKDVAPVEKSAEPDVHPEYRRIMAQNEALREMRPQFIELAKGMQDGADAMEKIAAELGELRKICGVSGSGDALAKTHGSRDSLAKGADQSREIVASIDQILKAPLPLWLCPTARKERA